MGGLLLFFFTRALPNQTHLFIEWDCFSFTMNNAQLIDLSVRLIITKHELILCCNLSHSIPMLMAQEKVTLKLQAPPPPPPTIHTESKNEYSILLHGGENKSLHFKYAIASRQGYRETQEDRYVYELDFLENGLASMFAVFDGHAGDRCSQFLADHFLSYVKKSLMKYVEQGSDDFACVACNDAYNNLREPSLALQIPLSQFLGNTELMSQLMYQIDEDFRKSITDFTADGKCVLLDSSGSTGNIVCIENVSSDCHGDEFKVTCINVGDSRCILYNEGVLIPMSLDHKPYDPNELRRIVDCFGFVHRNRLNGELAMSRAFGDFSFKQNCQVTPDKQILVATPDIKQVTIHVPRSSYDDYQFLIIACDGLFDVLSNQEAVRFVASKLKEQEEQSTNGFNPEAVANQLVSHAIDDLGSTDNVTVILIVFGNFPASDNPNK